MMTETSTYKSLAFFETILAYAGASATATWPNEIFLTVIASKDATVGNGGSFTIGYQYEDRDPDTVIANMSLAERDAYYNRKRIIEE